MALNQKNPSKKKKNLHHVRALYQPTLKIFLHDDLALNHQTIMYLHLHFNLPTNTLHHKIWT